MCAGGIQGYVRNGFAHNNILKPVGECARVKDCIAPTGATLANHRFDQAIFSIYLHENNIKCQTDPKFWGNRGNNRCNLLCVMMKLFININNLYRQPDAPNGVTLDAHARNNMILYSRRGWGIDYDQSIGQPVSLYFFYLSLSIFKSFVKLRVVCFL